MESPLPARRPDEPGDIPDLDGADVADGPDAAEGIEVGEFPQGSPLSRWALARYIVGRVILERVSWSLMFIALAFVVLGVLGYVLLDSTFLAVVFGVIVVVVLLLRALLRAVLHRLMGARAYGPLQDRLSAIVDRASDDVLAELRRVGLPSRLITLPLIGVRLIGKRRKGTIARMRQFEVERAVPRSSLDELHMQLRDASGPVPPQAGAA